MKQTIFTLIVLLIFASSAYAKEAAPSTALIRAEESLAGIKKLKADVKFHILLKNLGFSFVLKAVYRYTPESHVEISFRSIPAFFSKLINKGLKSSINPSGLPQNYGTDYKIESSKIEKVNKTSCYFIKLIPVAKVGPLKTVFLWISTVNYTIPKEMILYRDGMHITVYRKYDFIHHYYLTREAKADLNDPNADLEAAVRAEFRDYRIHGGD